MRPARSSVGTGRSMSALWRRDPPGTRRRWDRSSLSTALPRGPVSGSFRCAMRPAGQLAESFGSRFWPLGRDAAETEESGDPRPSSASHRAGRLRRLRRTGGDCVQCPLSETEASRCSHDVR